MQGVPPPFVAYLRVYEPVGAFPAERRAYLRRAVAAGGLPPQRAGDRERELWLRAQLADPPRLLPGERSDGSAAAETPADVLVLPSAALPAEEDAPVGPGPLVCPLDVRPRAAAALLGFLAGTPPQLQAAALPVDPAVARVRAESVVAGLGPGAVHVVSATWTVPLPWFSLVDPTAGVVDVSPPPSRDRRVSWRVAMATARRRVARAHATTLRTLGEDGPATVLRDTGRWLQHFDARSVVELDYGGLVHLLDDERVSSDSSAADVHAALQALESGDAEQVASSYERLRDFWGDVAAFERTG